MKLIVPMQPKPVEKLPTGPEWTYEVKFDGYRALAVKEGPGTARLFSRTHTDLTPHFATVANAVAQLPVKSVMLDGELVALDTTGRPSFRALQEHHRHIADAKPFALAYFVFDLLELNGESWLARLLSARRRRLASLIRGDTLLVSSTLPGTVAKIEQQVKRFGLEGVVAKRRYSRYVPGVYTDDWVKLRYYLRDEFVVGGYVPNGDTFEALLVGRYTSEGELRYAGQVRTGFTPRMRAALALRLKLAGTGAGCPFADLPHDVPRRPHPWDQRIPADQMRRFRWLPPSDVIEVAYLGWTRHNLLRQPDFVAVPATGPCRMTSN